MKSIVARISFFILMFFIVLSCKKAKTQSTIETLNFKNGEWFEYCLPVPKEYKKNNEYEFAQKAQHQFLSTKNRPSITLKGQMLKGNFTQLQTTIENQLKEMNVDNPHLLKDDTTISYTFEKDNKIIFEKKWAVKDGTVTVIIKQPKSENTAYFNQLKLLYLAAKPNCL